MNRRYVCSVCGGNCDAGELVNGVCYECRQIKFSYDASNGEEPKFYEYVIKKGDTLKSIYEKTHYPIKITLNSWVARIAECNSFGSEDSVIPKLEIGKILKIPMEYIGLVK